jgi:dolichyl-phosphate-mannose-protein mannosyltransferase
MREDTNEPFFSIQSIKTETLVYVGLVVMGAFIFLRFWRLGIPSEIVFDEVYYPKFAHQILNGESFFDVHPPLGKLIIALGELLFGDKAGTNALGWRIMPALMGSCLIPVSYWASRQIFDNKIGAFTTAFLVAIDGMFIVYSRTGLMDIFIIFFGVISVGFCWKFRRARLDGKHGRLLLLATGAFAGLAMAVKWTGAAFPLIMAVTTLYIIFFNNNQKYLFADFLAWLLAFFLLPFAIYTLPFLATLPFNGFWHEFFNWHNQALDYSLHLDATHPYASKWWSWPFLVKPVWFYYKDIGGIVTGINGVGNPLTWWTGTVAIIYSIYSFAYTKTHSTQLSLSSGNEGFRRIKKDEITGLIFILGGWAACYFPWMAIGRIVFLYHYMPAHIFALFLCGFWIGRTWENMRWRKAAIIFLTLSLALSLFFIPVWTAYPVPKQWIELLTWFETWT